MKKTIKSIVTMLAFSGILFTSCDDKKNDPVNPGPSSSVTITLNGGEHKEIPVSQFIDPITVTGNVSITGSATLKRIEVKRSLLSLPGEFKLVYDTSFSKTTATINIQDVRGSNNLPDLKDDEKITYLVKVTDSEGSTYSDSVVFAVKPLSITPSSIILGSTANSLNNNKFLGYANNFQVYSTGTDSVSKDPFGNAYKPARRNSDKIDFVFYSNIQTAAVKAAMYSPDYPFASGEGWNAEIATWPSKRTTMFIRMGSNFSNSQFNNSSDPSNLAVVDLIRKLKFDGNDVGSDGTTKLPAPTNKIAKLINEEIIAFKTQDGKVGLMLIAVAPTNDLNGTYQVQIKMMP